MADQRRNAWSWAARRYRWLFLFGILATGCSDTSFLGAGSRQSSGDKRNPPKNTEAQAVVSQPVITQSEDAERADNASLVVGLKSNESTVGPPAAEAVLPPSTAQPKIVDCESVFEDQIPGGASSPTGVRLLTRLARCRNLPADHGGAVNVMCHREGYILSTCTLVDGKTPMLAIPEETRARLASAIASININDGSCVKVAVAAGETACLKIME